VSALRLSQAAVQASLPAVATVLAAHLLRASLSLAASGPRSDSTFPQAIS